MALFSTGNGGKYWRTPSRGMPDGVSGPLWMVCWARGPALGTTGQILCGFDRIGSTVATRFVYGFNDSTNNVGHLSRNNANTLSQSLGSAQWPANQWNHIYAYEANASSRGVFINGVAGPVDTGTVAGPQTLDSFAILGSASSPTFNGATTYSVAEVAYGWGILSTAQLAAMVAGQNPLTVAGAQLAAYFPLRGSLDDIGPRRIGLVPTGSPATVWGEHPLVNLPFRRRVFARLATGNVSITPGAGALTLAGPSPSVAANATVAAGNGALTVAGLAPAVAASAAAAPSPGALTLIGQQPSVVATVAAAPDAGALTLAGLAPTVSTAGNVSAVPGAGALALAGQQPAVAAAATVASGAGTLTLAGYAPSVSTAGNVSVAPGAGAISLTGQQPTIRADAAAGPGAGALTLTGQAPSLSVGGSISITLGVGTLTLAGYAPAVLATATIGVGVGAIALSGLQPTVTSGASAVPGVGALALGGLAPTFQAHVAATPGVGGITLTGRQPTVSLGFAATPGVGLIVLAGYSPSLGPSGVIAPSIFEAGNVASIPADNRAVTISGSA